MSELVAQTMAASLVGSETIDTQVSTAKKYPRDIARAKAILQQLIADPEAAQTMVYVRPVGRDKSGKIVYAQGMSIRLAEALASAWGNVRFGAQVVEVGPRTVKARAFCWDMESNVAAATETVESCVDANGNPYSERQRAVVAKAAAKKALRDAILTVIPRAVSEAVYAKCCQVIKAKQAVRPAPDRVERIKEKLRELGVAEERALAAVGANSWAEASDAQVGAIASALRAIEDEETTPELAFPELKEQAQAAQEQSPSHQPAASAQPTQEQEKQVAGRVASLRRHLKNVKLTEQEWLAAAVSLGIATANDTLETLAANKWDDVFMQTAAIDRAAKERRAS